MSAVAATFLPPLELLGASGSRALDALAALGQQTRLAVFRYLVSHEPCGKTVGEIAVAMQCPQNTASGYLAILARAQLVSGTRQGRTVVYRADPSGMQWLLQYLLRRLLQRRPFSVRDRLLIVMYRRLCTFRNRLISIDVDIKSVASEA